MIKGGVPHVNSVKMSAQHSMSVRLKQRSLGSLLRLIINDSKTVWLYDAKNSQKSSRQES